MRFKEVKSLASDHPAPGAWIGSLVYNSKAIFLLTALSNPFNRPLVFHLISRPPLQVFFLTISGTAS
jgi:hypothetical protein